MGVVSDINAGVAEVVSGLQTASASVSSALLQDTWTDRQVRHLTATVTGLRADLRGERRILDALDVSTLVDRADDCIALWRWERTTRQALISLDDTARIVAEGAEELRGGRKRRLHIVRSGETLQSIAGAELGSWKEWPRLAAANSLSPGPLTAGQVLIVPDRR